MTWTNEQNFWWTLRIFGVVWVVFSVINVLKFDVTQICICLYCFTLLFFNHQYFYTCSKVQKENVAMLYRQMGKKAYDFINGSIISSVRWFFAKLIYLLFIFCLLNIKIDPGLRSSAFNLMAFASDCHQISLIKDLIIGPAVFIKKGFLSKNWKVHYLEYPSENVVDLKKRGRLSVWLEASNLIIFKLYA